ncbi:MAG: extracellular solute-binding protein, partial [Clostridia bacterium]|nr:extracellular solute-binding protein [Clostridia bacterium]
MKKNAVSRLLAVVLTVGMLVSLVFSFASCGGNDGWDFEEIDTEYKGTTLHVYNWGEYISDGSEGSLNVVKAFEKVYGIKVKYDYFSTNEEMYAQLKTGASYDVVIPSDYMIERLIKEDLIQKIDTSDLANYKNISSDYKGLYFDPNDEYSVPYSVGMVGIVYDKTKVNPADYGYSWSLLWSKDFETGDLINMNNPRDA